MISCKRPAHFVVSASLVGHIGLNINAIDSFAFIEVIANGIPLIIEPFGITDLALLAQLRLGAKRVTIDGFVDFHACASLGASIGHIG